MGKRVLGNDPFLRGAAVRQAPEAEGPQPVEPPEAVAPRSEAPAAKRKRSKARRGLAAQTAPHADGPGDPFRAVEVQVPAPAEAPPHEGRRPDPDLTERLQGLFRLAREILGTSSSSESVALAAKAAGGLLRALTSGLGTSGPKRVDIYGKDAGLVESLGPLANFLYERYWRVTVENARALPRGPVMLVANHSGALPLDGPVLYEAIRRERPDLHEPRWLVEDQIFYAPFLGTLMNRMGAVRACPENAVRLLGEGRPVVVFPEGIQGISKPYRERYQLKRFGRGGFVKIALKRGVPIVPVAIVGAEETLPLLTKLPGASLGLPYLPITPLGPIPLPAKWYIRFGEPLELSGLGPEKAEDIAIVQQLTEQTRQSIQSMLDPLLRDRGSVFVGAPRRT